MHRTATEPRPGPLTLDDVEQRLPIPDDVLIVEETLPSGNGWWVPQHRVILMRPGMSLAERNFVLAHETAHIILGHGTRDEDPWEVEREADLLAGVLLLGAVERPSRRRAVRAELARRMSA